MVELEPERVVCGSVILHDDLQARETELGGVIGEVRNEVPGDRSGSLM